MKSEMTHLSLMVFFVLFILLQKSGGSPTSCIDMQCGSTTSCVLKKCFVSEEARITIFCISRKCDTNPWYWNYGYFKYYIWTTGCCALRVHVCYGSSSQVNGDAFIVSSSTTVSAKTLDSSSKTEKDHDQTRVVSNSTTGTTSSIRSVSVSATTTDQGSNDIEDNDFMIISTMTMVQASPFEMNMANSDHDGEGNRNRFMLWVLLLNKEQLWMICLLLFTIALKVALPVGIFVLVILLAVLGFVFRRKVKGLMGQFHGPSDKSPDLLNPVYGINSPAFDDTAGDKFDNLTYAMQTGQEHTQSGNFPTGGYDYAKPLPQENAGEKINENKSKTVGDSSEPKYQSQYEEVGLEKPCDLYNTTYKALNGESCNASYDHIMGSHAEIMTSPHARLGGTAYDNAAI